MKGEEIMNTFGQLPNYSLLHTYGFAIPGNSCDAVRRMKMSILHVFQ